MLKTFVLSDAIQTVKATTTDTKAAKKQLHRQQRPIPAIQMTISRWTLTEKRLKIPRFTLQISQSAHLDYLKTAFAQNTYGTNVTAKTSVTAVNNSAILAVNGDYYGANN